MGSYGPPKKETRQIELELKIEAAEKHAEVYKGTSDGSYQACLASYNYWSNKKELKELLEDK